MSSCYEILFNDAKKIFEKFKELKAKNAPDIATSLKEKFSLEKEDEGLKNLVIDNIVKDLESSLVEHEQRTSTIKSEIITNIKGYKNQEGNQSSFKRETPLRKAEKLENFNKLRSALYLLRKQEEDLVAIKNLKIDNSSQDKINNDDLSSDGKNSEPPLNQKSETPLDYLLKIPNSVIRVIANFCCGVSDKGR